MLEIRNLTKIYKPKKGVPVTAVDHISLRFPETGMVFLLGRSGSGKSTLLNLLGGLDVCDEGEIFIRGGSTRHFRQPHFDSYRNTYVGFIFQEYNVLEEFTVGANIALAIELQGKKATNEQINAILKEVDLEGYGARRPNELSGGQKQRVAIARALVKQPRIIMADEPSGALDSSTGRQIFDTLKKLSAERLVIVVSHDREFAEQYADRIIELADGKVISDMTYAPTDPAVETAASPLTYEGDTVTIAPGYRLTEEDRLAINRFLDDLGRSGKLQAGKAARQQRATPTDQTAIPASAGGFSLIRSRLPLRSAFKIGAGSLKHKRFRLIITILLSCIAFGLFGLADTFGSYNHVRACTDSILDTGLTYASVAKTVRPNPESTYFRDGYHLTQQDIAAFETETGVTMQGVYQPSGWDMTISGQTAPGKDLDEYAAQVYTTRLNGFATVAQDTLTRFGYALIAGRLPDGNKDEIALSAYAAETFVQLNYANEQGKPVKIASPSELVGKTILLGSKKYTVTGIIDTHFDLSRYETLAKKPENPSSAQQLIRYALMEELRYAADSSLHCSAFVGEGYVDKMIATTPSVHGLNWEHLYFTNAEHEMLLDPLSMGTLSDLKSTPVVWLDGKPRTALGEKELVITTDLLFDRIPQLSEETEASAIKDALARWSQETGDISEQSSRCYLEENDYAYTPISGYQIVGYIDPKSPQLYQTVITGPETTAYFTGGDAGEYDFAIGPMPTDEKAVETLVRYAYTEIEGTRLELQSAVTYELDMINGTLAELSKIFLYIGLGFALFAAVMLANFISTSIAYKKQEIGILRAIGSRSSDVFRIFFSESFLITMINFLLSATAVGVATAVINHAIRDRLNVLVTILHFGPRQGVLLLAVSLLVAALASFFPVWHIAKKRPIDAIRNR